MLRFFIGFTLLFNPLFLTNANAINWNKEVIYFSLLDRFADGDTSNNFNVNKKEILSYHGGDLKGFSQKLSYVQELGANSILFTPLLDNRDTDFFGHWALHGYWPTQHFQLDEHWGTFKDLQNFTTLRKKEGMTFIADIVLNHVAWDHPWLDSNKDWFNTLGPIQDWNDQDQLERGQVTGLPDLNQDHKDVYDTLLKYTKFWITKTEAEGLRFDAIKHIPHHFWKSFLADIKAVAGSDALLLGELLHGDPHQYIGYADDGFNSFYNYPLYYSIKDVVVDKRSFYNLASRWQELNRLFGNKITWINFIDNHDLTRFLDLSQDVTKTDMLQALAMAFFSPGTPLLYYGTEELMRGKDGEHGRKSMTFKRKPIFDDIHKMIQLRKEYGDLLGAKREVIAVDDDYVVSRSLYKGQELTIVFYRDNGQQLDIPMLEVQGNVTSLIDQKMISFGQSKLNLKRSARGFDLLLRKNTAKNPQHVDSVEVTIHLNTPSDGDFYLVGNLDILGGWDSGRALSLIGDTTQKTITLKLAYNEILSFKFIEKNGKQVIWEPISSNRFLRPNENGVLSFKWGSL